MGGKRPERVRDNRGVHEVLVTNEEWKKVIAGTTGRDFSRRRCGRQRRVLFLERCGGTRLDQKARADGKIGDFAALPDWSGEIKFGIRRKTAYAAAGKKIVSFGAGRDARGLRRIARAKSGLFPLAVNHAGNVYCGGGQGRGDAHQCEKRNQATSSQWVDHMTMILTPDQGFIAFIDHRIANIFFEVPG